MELGVVLHEGDAFALDGVGHDAGGPELGGLGFAQRFLDGRDIVSVYLQRVPAEGALAEAAATKGKPTCIVAHTIKGKGVSFMENNPKFHGVAPTQDELKLALQELN